MFNLAFALGDRWMCINGRKFNDDQQVELGSFPSIGAAIAAVLAEHPDANCAQVTIFRIDATNGPVLSQLRFEDLSRDFLCRFVDSYLSTRPKAHRVHVLLGRMGTNSAILAELDIALTANRKTRKEA
jgi:hypothetical protein